MSIEEAIIEQAQPLMLSAQIRELIGDEISKGCSGELFSFPVSLMPNFTPLAAMADMQSTSNALPSQSEDKGQDSDWLRQKVWISPKQAFNWNRAELFIKQLSSLSHRIALEVSGNGTGIEITLLTHVDDVPIIRTAFAGVFENSKLTLASKSLLDLTKTNDNEIVIFDDYYPPPPYFHLLTSFEELKTSPLETFICALHEIPVPKIGFYQCVFQPVPKSHNWHRNVEILHDLEYESKLHSGLGTSSRYPQQLPSGNLQGTATEVETKAHNDKPFFFVSVRTGISGNGLSSATLKSLGTAMNLFRHGGKALNTLGHEEYLKTLSTHQCRELIQRGLCYRPGFLLNSRELAGLAHIVPIKTIEEREINLPKLETLPVKNPRLRSGTCIGISECAGIHETVHIPPGTRDLATHLIAASGMGKSTIMTNMFLQDIEEGKGAVFIDAHGDAVQQLLGLIPEEHVHRCIYFNPDDPDWVPQWNPLQIPPDGQDHIMADNFGTAFERVSRDWGDRLATILRQGLIGLAHVPNSTLTDLFNLARRKSDQSEDLRKQIVHYAKDDSIRNFWDRDFLKDYREADLTAVKHKLTRLMPGGTIKAMFSQPKSTIQFRQIMDEGKILFVDLASLGSDSRKLLGSLILTLFYMAALSRYKIAPKDRKPFSIFADEAHLFVSADAIENIVTQTRKFAANLCIANQYNSQFQSKQVDALTSVGTTIMGRMSSKDSRFFMNDLQDQVEVQELTGLEKYEMIARIGTDVVRIKTIPNSRTHDESIRQRILDQTHQNYCVSTNELKRRKLSRQNHLREPDLNSDIREHNITAKDLVYDEF